MGAEQPTFQLLAETAISSLEQVHGRPGYCPYRYLMNTKKHERGETCGAVATYEVRCGDAHVECCLKHGRVWFNELLRKRSDAMLVRKEMVVDVAKRR